MAPDFAAAVELDIAAWLDGELGTASPAACHSSARSRRGAALDVDWQALADPACTLAIHMGRERRASSAVP